MDFSPVDRVAAIERKGVNQAGSNGRGGGHSRLPPRTLAASAPWRCQRLPRGARHRTHPVSAEARDLLVDGFDAREDVNQLIPELGLGFGQLCRQRIALALKRCCPTGSGTVVVKT